MALCLGIIGLPNAGKSTLFNALTEGSAEGSNYPFCTIEPNIGVVDVPDTRLQRLAKILQPASSTPTAIRFVDVAGLVRGASKGEGLGNKFLGHLREADALVHVVRYFSAQQVAHMDGGVNPLRDVETIETELMLADLESVERGISRLEKIVRTDPRSAQRPIWEALKNVLVGLQEGVPVCSQGLSAEDREALIGYNFLTAKPVLYVANGAGEGAEVASREIGPLKERVGKGRVLPISAQLEAEIAQLPAVERGEFVAELGIEVAGIEQLILACYRLLDLISFYTVSHDKLQAWQLPRGMRAPQAAGRIHSDMERGFIRAEIASFDDLVTMGSLAGLKEAGKLRTEGKDYIIQDGDVVTFLFRA